MERFKALMDDPDFKKSRGASIDFMADTVCAFLNSGVLLSEKTSPLDAFHAWNDSASIKDVRTNNPGAYTCWVMNAIITLPDDRQKQEQARRVLDGPELRNNKECLSRQGKYMLGWASDVVALTGLLPPIERPSRYQRLFNPHFVDYCQKRGDGQFLARAVTSLIQIEMGAPSWRPVLGRVSADKLRPLLALYRELGLAPKSGARELILNAGLSLPQTRQDVKHGLWKIDTWQDPKQPIPLTTTDGSLPAVHVAQKGRRFIVSSPDGNVIDCLEHSLEAVRAFQRVAMGLSRTGNTLVLRNVSQDVKKALAQFKSGGKPELRC